MKPGRLAISASLIAFVLTGPCLSANAQDRQDQRTLVIHAGRLFTATSDTLATNQDIVIEGDRIVEVGPAGTVKVPAGAQKIDLGNATVLPGMIDGHAHMFKYKGHEANYQTFLHDSWQYRTILATVNVKTDLNAGFTTGRDMMSVGAMYSDTDVRRAVNEGIIPGPRLQVATIALTGTGWGEGYPPGGLSPEVNAPLGLRTVDSPWEGRKAVRENVKYGADFIKVFADKPEPSRFAPDGHLLVTSALTSEEEGAIVDEAHRQGIKAACHAFGGAAMRDSIDVGCNDIEFGVDLDQQSLTKMAEKGTFLTMELIVGKAAEQGELKRTGGKFCRAALQKETFQRALKTGVKIAFTPNAGSGPVEHGEQAKEFAMQVQYGMTPAQALRTATIVNAEMMGWQDRIGTIEKGKFADIIAVSGNPLDDITEMQRVKFVMKGGEIVRNDLK